MHLTHPQKFNNSDEMDKQFKQYYITTGLKWIQKAELLKELC